MFSDIECLNPAYNRLVKSGITKRILKCKPSLEKIFLYEEVFAEGEPEKLLNHARNSIGTSLPHEREVFNDICELYEDVEECLEPLRIDGEFEKALLSHPSFLGYLTLGKDIFNNESFGFPTREGLEQAVTSFCIGEDQLVSYSEPNSWIWRNKKFKNKIFLNEHGDFYASQKDVSGKEQEEETLFGKSISFDVFGERKVKGAIYAYQNWSCFLVSLLKYSEVIGKNKIQEITDWKRIMGQIGQVGTNTCEAMFGGDTQDYQIDFLLQSPILTKGREIDTFPLSISGRETTQIPYVEDGKLTFLREEKEGDAKLYFNAPYFKEKRFSVQIEYDENDLIDALKAVYKFFARDKRDMYKIMEKFNK